MSYALCMIGSEVRARAANARRICLAHGIAQADIAAHVGASQSQVSRILKGEGVRASRLFEEVCLFLAARAYPPTKVGSKFYYQFLFYAQHSHDAVAQCADTYENIVVMNFAKYYE